MKPKTDPLASLYGEYFFKKAILGDHFFRSLLKEINWESIRSELMTDSSEEPIEYSDRGRTAWDPVIIFKMLLLQRLHPASDRKVEERAKMDVSYRFFLQLPFPSPVPDATCLTRYRAFWGDAKIKEVFINIFRQIKSRGFARVRPGLVGDTTHQHASIQKPTARQLLLDCFEKYLHSFMELANGFPASIDRGEASRLVQFVDFWSLEYSAQCRGGELERRERFSMLVDKIQEVRQVVQQLLPERLPPVVIESESWRLFQYWKTMLDRLLAENVGYKDGRPYQRKKGRKIISLVDPDARAGQKSKTNRFNGYKVVVSMTCDRFYSGLETIPGNESDMLQAIPLVEEAIKTSGETPEAVALDLGFNSISNRRALHGMGIQPGIKFEPRINPRHPGLYTADDFQFDDGIPAVTCPAGQTTRCFTLNKQTGMMVFRFAGKDCDACPRRKKCTTSKTGRRVQFSP